MKFAPPSLRRGGFAIALALFIAWPFIGVPSASAKPGMDHEPAGYNLYRIDGVAGAWRCEMVSRGIGADGKVTERTHATLFS